MSAKLPEATQQLVNQWLEWDINLKNRSEIQELVNKGDAAELSKILSKRIAFGTAGAQEAMIFILLPVAAFSGYPSLWNRDSQAGLHIG